MKIKKGWFYFTLAAAAVITTIITNFLYINGADKIILFVLVPVLLLALINVIINKIKIIAPVVSIIIVILIFCSSSFLIMARPNEFAVYCQDGQIPVVLESGFKLAIPYTYDVVVFNRHQKLIIIGNNQRAVVDFELPKNNVFMVQHGFADQKDFADKIQAQAYSKFFTINDADRKAYLDSFSYSYGLIWKKVIIEINIDNVQ